MSFRLATALALVVAAGCTDFSEVPSGVCGNFVLEAGEDCDDPASLADGSCGAAGSDNACALVCSAELSCPVGWGCGDDGRCRRASGGFAAAPGSPWSFDVDSFTAGDVDGDGNLDLIGHQRDEVQLRFGAGDGSFGSELRVVTQQPTGEINFADFDGDSLIDVVVPIQDGLFVLRGTPERTLEPIAYAPSVIGDGAVAVVPLESVPNLVTELLFIDFDLDLMAFIGSSAAPAELPVPLDDGDLARPLPTAPQGDGQPSVMALAPRGSATVYVVIAGGGIEGESNTLYPVTYDIALPLGSVVADGASFADVNGDGFADLLVSIKDEVASRFRVAIAPGFGDGEFGPATAAALLDRDAGRPHWILTAGDLTGEGQADFVYADGIFIRGAAGSATLTRTAAPVDAPWSDAVIGDFNGDGLDDVATATRLEERIDVYLSAGNGLFNVFPIPTEGVPKLSPRTLVAADFDGDFVDDLAFAVGGAGVREDAIHVLYGHRQGSFAAPISMGAMDQVASLAPVSAVSSLETADAITDLMVASYSFPDAELATLSIMRGSSSRRLIAPFTLRDPSGGVHVPKRAIVGDFSSPPDGIRDILAAAQPPGELAGEADVARDSYLFLLPGSGSGGIAAEAVEITKMPETAGFDIRCAVYAVGDLDVDLAAPVAGVDELFGVDGAAACAGTVDASSLMVVRPPSAGSGLTDVAWLPLGPLDLSGPHRIRLVDLDLDGDLDLLALFRGEPTADTEGETGASGSGIAVLWNQAGELTLSKVLTLPGANAPGMLDVATLHVDDDGFPDLAIATAQGVWTALYQPDEVTFAAPVHAAGAKPSRAIATGDANGDGVDDVLVLSGRDVEIFLGGAAAPQGELPEKELP